MLRVIVQVIEGQSWATTKAIYIQNDHTGTWYIGNYNVRLTKHEIDEEVMCRVEGHSREEGDLSLVKKAIIALEEKNK